MKASDQAIALIKEFEGYQRFPYADVVGKMTIGYGHLLKAGETFPIAGLTESEATALLCKDLEQAENCINAYVDGNLTQPQFDALCSWIFNLGCGAFKGSTLLKKLNGKDYAGASLEIVKWNRAGGKEVAGLTRRRIAEQTLFNTQERKVA